MAVSVARGALLVRRSWPLARTGAHGPTATCVLIAVGPWLRRVGSGVVTQKCRYSGWKFWSGFSGCTPFSFTEYSAVAVGFGW
jgi:hypothetical protein